MGRLHVPSPTLKPHPRLSTGGVPPIIPQISIQTTGSPPSSSPPERSYLFGNVATSMKEPDDDLNLARYLQGGRRHTLGATQNNTLITPEQLQRLRESTELSSSNAGSTTTNSVVNRLGGMLLDSSNLQQALSFGTVVDHSSQNNMSGASMHRHLQPSRARMGRRVSDGGPYLKAYQKYFMERRNPNLAQINSSSALNQGVSSDVGRAGSMKVLRQQSKAMQQVDMYGAQRQWLQPQNSHVSFLGLLPLRAYNLYMDCQISKLKYVYSIALCKTFPMMCLDLNSVIGRKFIKFGKTKGYSLTFFSENQLFW